LARHVPALAAGEIAGYELRCGTARTVVAQVEQHFAQAGYRRHVRPFGTQGRCHAPAVGTADAARGPMEESRIAVLAALLGNLALAIVKGISAAVTGSAAMMAETFHSCADTGNQVLLFIGMRRAARPPDEVHPFGYGKDIYF